MEATNNFFENKQNLVKEKFNIFANKKRTGIITLVVLLLAIPLTVWLLQRTQIFSPRADIKPIELVASDDSCVVSTDPNKVSCGTFPIKLTSPYGPPAEIESCTSDSECRDGNKCFSHQGFPGTCRPPNTDCTQQVTPACNPNSDECASFPTPCHVPPGWIVTQPSPSPSAVASASPSPAVSPSPSPAVSPSPSPVCTTQATSKTHVVNSPTSITYTYTYPTTTKITAVNFPAKPGVRYSMNGQTSQAGQALNVNLGAGQSSISFTFMPTAACTSFTVQFSMTNNCGTQMSDFAGPGANIAASYAPHCQPAPPEDNNPNLNDPNNNGQNNDNNSGTSSLFNTNFFAWVGHLISSNWSVRTANAQQGVDLNNGLVSHWKFDETTGNTAADSKNISNGTVTNTTIVDGKFNKARQTGTNGFITAADNNAYKTNAFTVGGWINPTTFTNNVGDNSNYASIFSRRNGGNRGFTLEYLGTISGGGSGQLQCYLSLTNNADVTVVTDANGKLNANQWNFVACSYDGNTLKTYINGTLVKSTQKVGTPQNPDGASIIMGRNPINTEDFLNATLDEMMVWNRALTDAEIQSLAVGNLPGAPTASPSPAASASPPACVNLVKNFSFENPAVTKNNNGWQLFESADPTNGVTEKMSDWDAKANNAGYQVEIQRALKGPAAEGFQYAEVDMPGIVSLTQSIPTQQGKLYQLKFVYSSRPDVTTVQKMGVYWNGQQIATIDGTTHGNAIDWKEKSYLVTGVAGSTKLGFGALADTSNGAGNFIDKVSVTEISEVCGNTEEFPGTAFYRVAESEDALEDMPFIPYDENPTITDFSFEDDNPGVRQIWAEFMSATGATTVEHISVEIIEPDPIVTSLDCSMDLSRETLRLTLNGERFGSSAGKVSANTKDAQVNSWNSDQVVATLKPGGKLEDGQMFKVILTRKDGKVLPEIACQINTTLIFLGARLFCREPGKFDVNGVKVTLVDENGNKVNEDVTIDKDGIVKGLKTRLQVGKPYVLSIKAPFSLRRNAQFVAAGGTNVMNPHDGSAFILPVGDISPVIQPDGKINSLDRSEIARQWSVLINNTQRTGDFNRDTKVNSIDWACMRYDFNKEDDKVPAGAFYPAPETPVEEPSSPTPSGSPDQEVPTERGALFLLQPEATGSYSLNTEFGVDLRVWSQLEAANLFVAKLNFDPSDLQVVRIQRGSGFSNWTEEFFDNQTGQISLVAGVTDPGLTTTEGNDPLMAKIIFKGKRYINGSTRITINQGSRIYSNNDNKDILTQLGSADIAIPFPPD